MDRYIKHFDNAQKALENPNLVSPATVTIGEKVLFGDFGKDTPCLLVPDAVDDVAIGVSGTFDESKFNKSYFAQ